MKDALYSLGIKCMGRFLIWSIKKAGANCWVKGKGGTSESEEEERR